MFAKQLLTASVSRCIIQGFSYNLTVPSHVKLVKQCDHLETVKGKQQKYYQAAHNTYALYKDRLHVTTEPQQTTQQSH